MNEPSGVFGVLATAHTIGKDGYGGWLPEMDTSVRRMPVAPGIRTQQVTIWCARSSRPASTDCMPKECPMPAGPWAGKAE